MAVRRVDQSSHLELLEPDPEDPVPWSAPERTEPVPAGHWAAPRVAAHFGARDILVDVHRFVAVVPLRL